MAKGNARKGPSDWKRRQPASAIPAKAFRKLSEISEGELGDIAADLARLVEWLIGLALRHCRQSDAVLNSLVEGRSNDLERGDLVLSRLRRIEDALVVGRGGDRADEVDGAVALLARRLANVEDSLEQIKEALGVRPGNDPACDGESESVASELQEGLTSIVASLERIEKRTEDVEGSLGDTLTAARESQARTESLAESSTDHADSLQDLTNAVEHTRAVTQGIARKLGDLSQSVVDRQLDPIFCEMAKVHGELSRVATEASNSVRIELAAVSDQITRFLDSCNLLLIRPRPGEQADPRIHEIIKQETSGNGQPDGAVARLFWPGLERDKRIIRRAQVSVFRVNETPNHRKEKGHGSDHTQ